MDASHSHQSDHGHGQLHKQPVGLEVDKPVGGRASETERDACGHKDAIADAFNDPQARLLVVDPVKQAAFSGSDGHFEQNRALEVMGRELPMKRQP